MQWTVLGRYGPYPASKGATSGYLLRHKDRNILVDCGSGVLARLGAYGVPIGRLDAVLLTHLHHDHVSDMGVLQYALEDLQKIGARKTPLQLLMPEDDGLNLRAPWRQAVFAPHFLEDGGQWEFEGLSVRFMRTNHPAPCYAMRFEAEGKCLVYTGDTGLCEGLADFCRGCDMLFCDAKFFDEQHKEGLPHLTAGQAGQLASEANVGRLLLTHLPPNDELQQLLAQARRVFPKTRLAREGVTYSVQSRWTWLMG